MDIAAVKDKILNLLQKPLGQAAPAGAGSILACDFGKSKVVFLEAVKTAEEVTVLRFQKFSRSAEPAKATAELKQYFDSGGFQSRKIRISAKGQGVIVRFVQFPQMSLEDLRSAVTLGIDQYIPFKSHEVAVDFQILDNKVTTPSGTAMNVLLVAVKRDELYENIQIFQNAGLEIELVDVDALTAINVLESLHPEEFNTSAGILNIGAEISTLSVVHQGKPRFIRDMSYGGVDLIKRLKRKLTLSDQAAAEQLEWDRQPTPEAAEALKESIATLVSEIKVSLNYYLDQIQGAEPILKLFIMGGEGYHPILLQELKQGLGFPVEFIDVLSKVKFAATADQEMIKKSLGLFSVPFGLCLREL